MSLLMLQRVCCYCRKERAPPQIRTSIGEKRRVRGFGKSAAELSAPFGHKYKDQTVVTFFAQNGTYVSFGVVDDWDLS